VYPIYKKKSCPKKWDFLMGDGSSIFSKKQRLENSAAFWLSELEDTRKQGACVDRVQKAK
jgi:hypothetical protein